MLIKICGITNPDDASFVRSAGADWIGLNLVAGPRRIDLRRVEEILVQLGDPSPVVVLVSLVDGQIPPDVAARLRDGGVRRWQVYGEFPPAAVEAVTRNGDEVIAPCPVRDPAGLGSFDDWLNECGRTRPECGSRATAHARSLRGQVRPMILACSRR